MRELAELTAVRNYIAVIARTEALLDKQQEDIRLWYILATARFCAGQIEPGYAAFGRVLEICGKLLSANRDQPQKQMITFIGHCCLQALAFSDIFFNLENHSLRHTCARLASVLLDQAAELSKDTHLAGAASQFRKRIILPSGNAGPEAIPRFIPDSPYILQIEPTNNCNFNCIMCPRTRMIRKKGFIDESTLQQALDSWKNRFQSFSLKHILFGTPLDFNRPGMVKLYFMGEPLLHPGLGNLIDRIKNTKSLSGVQTNGFLLKNNDIIRTILEAGPSSVSISIDGLDAESYDRIRSGGKHAVLRKNLENLFNLRRDMGLEGTVSIRISTILPDYSDEAREMADTFLENFRPFSDGINYIRLNKRGTPSFIDASGKLKTYAPEQRQKATVSCHEPFEKLNLLWDGTFTPCCHDVDGTLALGTSAGGTDAVWNSSKSGKLRQALVDNRLENYPLCAACQASA